MEDTELGSVLAVCSRYSKAFQVKRGEMWVLGDNLQWQWSQSPLTTTLQDQNKYDDAILRYKNKRGIKSNLAIKISDSHILNLQKLPVHSIQNFIYISSEQIISSVDMNLKSFTFTRQLCGIQLKCGRNHLPG